MGTSRKEIEEWFEYGVEQGSTHLIVVCDTYDHDDYPVFVKPGEDVRKVSDQYNGKDMQRVMEVYVLDPERKEAQLREHRAFHYDNYTPPSKGQE